jgi:prepilin-type N-terminal cleavage/methylation domain-containing protein
MLIPPSFMRRQSPFRQLNLRSGGFTLLEILVVISIMTIMIGLVLGKSGAISGTQGMTAMHQVTAMCDLARARSLRGDGTVLMAFAAADGGLTGEPYRSVVLCAEDVTTEDPDDYAAISEWFHLPQGYVFTNVGAASPNAGVNVLAAPNATRRIRLPGNGPSVELPCVGFGSLGEVVFPEPDANSLDSLLIAIAEGQASSSGPLSKKGDVHRPDECRWLAVRRNSGSPMILP